MAVASKTKCKDGPGTKVYRFPSRRRKDSRERFRAISCLQQYGYITGVIRRKRDPVTGLVLDQTLYLAPYTLARPQVQEALRVLDLHERAVVA